MLTEVQKRKKINSLCKNIPLLNMHFGYSPVALKFDLKRYQNLCSLKCLPICSLYFPRRSFCSVVIHNLFIVLCHLVTMNSWHFARKGSILNFDFSYRIFRCSGMACQGKSLQTFSPPLAFGKVFRLTVSGTWYYFY